MPYVYIAHIIDDYYKIGWAINPKSRVYKLGLNPKTDIVHLIETPVPIHAEMAIHRMVETYRVGWNELPKSALDRLRGGHGEIFKLDSGVLAVLQSIPSLSNDEVMRYFTIIHLTRLDSSSTESVVSL